MINATPAISFYNSLGKKVSSPDVIEPEELRYLILLVSGEDSEENRTFEVIQGRIDAYEYIKSLIISESIDPINSFIMSNLTPLDEAVTIFEFMKYMKESGKITDNSNFDIADYVVEPGED